MDTIDPEVRADIEYAGSLLAKSIARRQASERLCDCATSARQGGPASVLSPSSGIALESARSSGATSGFATAAGTAPGASAASAAQPAYAQSTSGELDCAGFVALMEDVVGRTRGGLARAERISGRMGEHARGRGAIAHGKTACCICTTVAFVHPSFISQA